MNGGEVTRDRPAGLLQRHGANVSATNAVLGVLETAVAHLDPLGVDIDAVRFPTESLGDDERRAESRERVEDDVSQHRELLDDALDERFRRACVVTRRVSEGDPFVRERRVRPHAGGSTVASKCSTTSRTRAFDRPTGV
jgi:hypothetical protein